MYAHVLVHETVCALSQNIKNNGKRSNRIPKERKLNNSIPSQKRDRKRERLGISISNRDKSIPYNNNEKGPTQTKAKEPEVCA